MLYFQRGSLPSNKNTQLPLDHGDGYSASSIAHDSLLTSFHPYPGLGEHILRHQESSQTLNTLQEYPATRNQLHPGSTTRNLGTELLQAWRVQRKKSKINKGLFYTFTINHHNRYVTLFGLITNAIGLPD